MPRLGGEFQGKGIIYHGVRMRYMPGATGLQASTCRKYEVSHSHNLALVWFQVGMFSIKTILAKYFYQGMSLHHLKKAS